MTPDKIAFLFDVDNTLLDNDRVSADLGKFLEREGGAKRARGYWKIFEQLRARLGYADYLGALQGYRSAYPEDPGILTASRYLLQYPFADRLFPGALEVIAHVRQWAPATLLSDGDVVFQPHKVERSGLYDAVNGCVLIYAHKELQLEDVARRVPAGHYVVVDDKLRLLAAIKKIWGRRVTTVFVRQGHYAHDPKILATYPAADLTIECLGNLLDYDWANFTNKTNAVPGRVRVKQTWKVPRRAVSQGPGS